MILWQDEGGGRISGVDRLLRRANLGPAESSTAVPPSPATSKGRTPTAFSNGLRAGDGGRNALDTYDYRIRPVRALQHQRLPKVPMPDGSLPENPFRRIGALLLDGLLIGMIMGMLWLCWLWVCALD